MTSVVDKITDVNECSTCLLLLSALMTFVDSVTHFIFIYLFIYLFIFFFGGGGGVWRSSMKV